MQCPNCKLVNPPDAMWCDCGYDFNTGQLRGVGSSHGQPATVQKSSLNASTSQSVRPDLSRKLTRKEWIFLGLFAISLLCGALDIKEGLTGWTVVDEVENLNELYGKVHTGYKPLDNAMNKDPYRVTRSHEATTGDRTEKLLIGAFEIGIGGIFGLLLRRSRFSSPPAS
jgi:hypothetical protein